MPRRRLRTLVSRLFVAAFALWLPAATGQGGKATCHATTAFARSLTERPHLSCHGEKGANSVTGKSCCCRGEEAIRAAACGCHDGQSVYATAAHDPTMASWAWSPGARPALHQRRCAGPAVPRGELADAPDPPPPQASFPDHA